MVYMILRHWNNSNLLMYLRLGRGSSLLIVVRQIGDGGSTISLGIAPPYSDDNIDRT